MVMSRDMNCASSHSFVQDMILKHGLRDAMTVHNDNPPPTRYPGSRTIDFIMVSEELEDWVTDSSFLPFKLMVELDHGVLLAEIQNGHLLH